MRINRNIAANYASRLWSGLASFIFVPMYLRLIGSEAFGLISFSATLLGILFILDMGMSNAFARETARNRQPDALADLLHSLEIIYLCIVIIMIVGAIIVSKPIAVYWLNASQLTPSTVQTCVALMLAAAMLQVMMSLYIGGLLGANRHVAAASFQISFSIARSGLVLVLLYFQRSIELFFLWQVVTSLLFLVFIRMVTWRLLAPSARPRFSSRALREIFAFAGGMSGISLIAAINTQSDKLVVSKVFTLEQLGHYAIASLIGQVPSMMALPLAVTVLPRLTSHVAKEETGALVVVYMRFSVLVGAVALTAAAGVLVCAPALLTVVAGTSPSTELVAVSRLLAIGGALLAIQYMPYHLAVACGHTRTSLVLGLLSAITLPLMIIIGATQFGLLGAAVPWLAMNFVVAIVLAWRVTPRFLGSHLGEWSTRSVLIPTVINGAVATLAWPVVSRMADPRLAIIMTGVFCAASLGANIAVLLGLRRWHTPNPPASIETFADG